MSVYLRFLLIFFALPLFILVATNYRLLWRYRKTILLTVLATFIFGTPWDILSVKSGLWWYGVAPTIGVWIGVLPLEEYLFTLLIPLLIASLVLVVRQRLGRMFHVR